LIVRRALDITPPLGEVAIRGQQSASPKHTITSPSKAG